MKTKNIVTKLIENAIEKARADGTIVLEDTPQINIEIPRDKRFGDLATTVAMTIASMTKSNSKKIAESLLRAIECSDAIESVDIAGPGFINFRFKKSYWYETLRDIVEKGSDYGRIDTGMGLKVQVEFVSANPTGPLHIGHGRGAAVGDAIANLLSVAGYDVHREYYINDTGTQMKNLGVSTYLRYQEILKENGLIDDSSYHRLQGRESPYAGAYIREIASHLFSNYSDKYSLTKVSEEECIAFFSEYTAGEILDGIKNDLSLFRVKFDKWFSESGLYRNGEVDKIIKELQQDGHIYEEDGALWLRSTDFGDDKDRVVVRRGGEKTYFASDIAYHKNKFERGFKKIINLWGADHHGYVPRMKAMVKILGYAESLKILLVQLVTLLRGGKPVAMSTRTGEFITLREVIEEVGVDATRFIFLTRRPDSHLEFDLEIAKKQSEENPVYYVQYAHARISSVFRHAKEKGAIPPEISKVNLTRLDLPEEIGILRLICFYPLILEGAVIALEPHRLTSYLHELASYLHSYYNKYRIISEDQELTYARLYLINACGITLRNALTILGVSAPEKM